MPDLHNWYYQVKRSLCKHRMKCTVAQILLFVFGTNRELLVQEPFHVATLLLSCYKGSASIRKKSSVPALTVFFFYPPETKWNKIPFCIRTQ